MIKIRFRMPNGGWNDIEATIQVYEESNDRHWLCFAFKEPIRFLNLDEPSDQIYWDPRIGKWFLGYDDDGSIRQIEVEATIDFDSKEILPPYDYEHGDSWE